MSGVKKFTTAVKAESGDPEKAEVGSPVTIDLDGRSITFQPCTETEMALLITHTSAEARVVDKIATPLNILFGLMQPEDYNYLRARLFNRDDDFEATDCLEVIIHLIQEWTGDPTRGQSGSTRSRQSTGRSSNRGR